MDNFSNFNSKEQFKLLLRRIGPQIKIALIASNFKALGSLEGY